MKNTDRISLKNSKKLSITIDFDKSIEEILLLNKKIICYHDQILSKILSDFFLHHKINIKSKYLVYLNRKNQIIRKLEKSKTIKSLNLKNDDLIIISYAELPISKSRIKEIKINTTNSDDEKKGKENINTYLKFESKKNEIILNSINFSDIIYDKYKFENKIQKKKNYICLFGIMVILLILLPILLFTFLIAKDKRIKAKQINFAKEELIIQKRYPLNLLLRFNSTKKNIIEMDGSNSTQIISEISDFIFIVREQNTEKNEIDLMEKELLIGYIGFLNKTIHNKTNDIMNIYDMKLNEYLNSNNLKNLTKPDLKYIGEKGNLCFAKIEFYLNGEIKNYYIPNGFNEYDIVYIEEIAKLIIPKISSNLYIKSIDGKIKEMISESNQNYSNNETFDFENNITSKKRRLFNNKYKSYSIPYSNNTYNKRRLKEDNNTSINYTGDIYVEEYLEEPLYDSINIDLREANENLKNLDDNKTQNYSNLTQYSIKNIESDEAKMEGSSSNTTIYSIVDKDGILESVEQKIYSLMVSQDYDSPEEVEYRNHLNNKIYGNNHLSLDDMQSTENEDELKNNNVKFNISSIYIINSMIINRSDYLENETISKQLYEYFDNFTYKQFNIDSYNDKSNEAIFNENTKERNLKEEESYYGFKKLTYMKPLYDYNLLGFKMGKQIFTEISPDKGTTTSYFVMVFGNKNIKIKLNEQHSNLHIILERKNQMAYNLLLLLNQSNKDLKERNKHYIDIILDMERNITNIFKDYDYSDLFKDSLNDLYKQVQNFSGEFFIEFFSLVNRVYNNYTKILDKAINGKYDFIIKITEMTKEEYIKYIYNIIKLMELFLKNSLTFFENVEKELLKIEEFHIDLLYDIVDIINESKLIFQQFNRKLFKSIEKGILIFRNDINALIDEVIGDLLYITDFLSDNINKNEILKRAIDYNTRIDISIKLKNFRNIILIIMDMPIIKINKDYESEMSFNNENGIKNYSYKKQNEFEEDIEIKSCNLIKKIKSKINYIQLYDLYSENIDIINNINNRTINEYINDIYNNGIIDSLNLKPEFLYNNSNLTLCRNKSFEISKNILNLINKETYDINEFIFNYTKKYIEENTYIFHNNLYNFRNYFLDGEIQSLFEEFFLLVNRTIIKKMKEMIDFNYNLAFEYFDARKKFIFFYFYIKNGYFSNNTYDDYIYYNLFNKAMKQKFWLTGGFCTGFINKYYEYRNKFIEFFNLIYREELMILIENLFYKIKFDLINHVKEKLNSINKYYFDIKIYNNNFNFIEELNEEIIRLTGNIDIYFNEISFNKEKLNLINMYNEILSPYNNKIIEELDKYYNYLYNHIIEDPKTYECQEDLFMKYEYCSKHFIFICIAHSYKFIPYSCNHTNNINLVLTNIKPLENDLKIETDSLIRNFTLKIDKSLEFFTSTYQNLYSNLFEQIEKKINNSKINKLMNNYINNLNIIINRNFEEEIIGNLYIIKNGIIKSIEDKLYNLENNINLLQGEFFNNYYLHNNSQYLEYPEEIIYKINQFQEELIYNTNNTKYMIDYIYSDRINKTIKSINLYINNFINQNLKYILSNLNSSNMITKYFNNIYNEINLTFNKYINNHKEYIYDFNYNYEENFTFNLNDSINAILNNSNNFIIYLNNLINETFLIGPENCSQKLNDDSYLNYTEEIFQNMTIEAKCIKEKKKIDEKYSKYNFNTVKLRVGIYYTKNLLENIDSLLNDFNLYNFINIDKFNYYDKLLNDKNILIFYNETNYKLNQINNENMLSIEESLENFFDYLKEFYSFQKDYLNYTETINKIFIFQDKDFNNYINIKNNQTLNNIFSLLEQFNNTLFEQIYLRDKYDFCNINETYFKEVYKKFELIIDIAFKDYKSKINSFNNNYLFYNTIKNTLKKIENKKIKYYENIINDLAKNYSFILLNTNLNVGEKHKSFFQKELNKIELRNIYYLYEIVENYTLLYSNHLIEIVENIEYNVKKNLEDIYNYFYLIYNNGTTYYINDNFIENFKKNYTFCLNYSTLLNKSNDNENKEIFNNISEIINIIYENCSNNNSDTIIFSFDIKVNFILEKKNNCTDILKDFNYISYYNETIDFLNCYKNNFYNYSIIYFNKFFDIYYNDLYYILNKIIHEIRIHYIDEYFLSNYLEENFQIEVYQEMESEKISYYLQDIEDNINYLNVLKKDNIYNFIFNLLISNFNSSYYNLLNNFIVNELVDNLTILINKKIELQLDYILKKIKDEYNYYLLILNKTDAIGISSKIAFINLYKKFNDALNETLSYFIEDIYFYLDIIYKENKKNFRNSFINYYINNKNKYDIDINELSNFINELIIDKKFNKTLDSILNELIYNLLFDKIKNNLKNSVILKKDILFTEIKEMQIGIEKILNNKETKYLPNNMLVINNLLTNFTEIVNKQNNRFILKISNKTFNLLYDFINYDLEPPLILIKDTYNKIEEILLNKLLKKIESFPDYYSIIQNNLNLESINNNILLYLNNSQEIFINYTNSFDKDIKNYINKLTHYTFINGLLTLDEPCSESFCYIDIDNISSKSNKTRRLEQNNNIFIDMKKLNKTKINKLTNKNIINLDGYNSKMGAITENDIDYYILEINDTLYNFNKSYLNKEYKEILPKIKKLFMKINNTNLNKLKKNIDKTGFKFSSILTKDIYTKLNTNLCKQYNYIESYINNASQLIENNINKFLNLLNFSSNIINYNYILVSTRTKNYYEILNNLIQKNIKYINEDEIKNYKIRILGQKNEEMKNEKIENEKNEEGWMKWLNDITSEFSEENIDKFKNNYGEYILDTKEWKDEFYKLITLGFIDGFKYESVFKKFKIDVEGETEIDKNEIKNTLNFCIDIFKINFKKIYFPLNLFPGLQLGLLIKPNLDLKICINLGSVNFRKEDKKDESHFFLGAEGGASMGLNLEFGFYCPSARSPVQISFTLGIKGILASGKIGMKLQFFYFGKNAENYLLDLYYEFKVFEFVFYIKLSLSIEIDIINFSYSLSYYIYKHDFNVTYSIEYHLNRYYKKETNKEIKEKCIKKKEIRKAKYLKEETKKCY